jgi:hypothetical protein
MTLSFFVNWWVCQRSYYYVPVVRDDRELRCSIEQTCLRHTRYGYRRVTPVVKKKHEVGKDRVRLLMKDMDLQVGKHRRKVRTTRSAGHKSPGSCMVW